MGIKLILSTLLVLGMDLFINEDVIKDRAGYYNQKDICVSPGEYRLFLLINNYRRTNGLNELKLSRALTYVSQLHAWDLSHNNPVTRRCNLHSWSGKGFWKECCYTDNHRNAECMWFKPKELTGYPGIGYEIVYYSTYPEDNRDFPRAALNGWMSSRPHNDIILNLKNWEKVHLETIGVGIYSRYVVVWFGTVADADGKPTKCVDR